MERKPAAGYEPPQAIPKPPITAQERARQYQPKGNAQEEPDAKDPGPDAKKEEVEDDYDEDDEDENESEDEEDDENEDENKDEDEDTPRGKT